MRIYEPLLYPALSNILVFSINDSLPVSNGIIDADCSVDLVRRYMYYS